MAFEFISDLFDFSVEAEQPREFTPEQIRQIQEYGAYRQRAGELKVLLAVSVALFIAWRADKVITAIGRARNRKRNIW